MTEQPTQVRFPWRATVRTTIQVLPALAVAVPLVVVAVEQDHPGLLGPVGVVAVAASGIVTRVMALPAVNDLLTRFGLGAEPRG
jgi:hypothetical protein